MTARLVLCAGCIAYVGPVSDNRLHRHHASQIAVSLEGPLLLRDAEREHRVDAAFIPADLPHAVDSMARPITVLLLEAAGRQGSAVTSIRPLNGCQDAMPRAALRSLMLAQPGCPRRIAQTLLRASPDEPRSLAAMDARVARAKEIARSAEGNVRLTELARSVGLSPGRLTHLFAACEGISFKRWLLWDRLLRAVDHLAAGADLTTAAHAASFADSAHFSRSFMATFGITASGLFRSRSVQVLRCPQH